MQIFRFLGNSALVELQEFLEVHQIKSYNIFKLFINNEADLIVLILKEPQINIQ